MNEAAYYDALLVCAQRYKEMADQTAALYQFILLYEESVIAKDPLMKMNRWLGFIQGTLIAEGKTTIEAERDFTRPLFRTLDFG